MIQSTGCRMANSDDPERQKLIADETRSYEGHTKWLKIYRALQIACAVIGGISGSVIAFAQTDHARDTIYSSPEVLFWVGIVAALAAALPSAVGLNAEVAKQRSRSDFHAGILGRLGRGTVDTQEAKKQIDAYFAKRQNGT
jgi:hypothetical protein